MDFCIDLSTGIVFLLVGILTYLIAETVGRTPGTPPGPALWPIVGNIPLIIRSKDLIEAFRDIRKQYGDIFSLKLGSQFIVVINGYDNIRDALVRKGELFTDRPSSFIFDKVELNGK